MKTLNTIQIASVETPSQRRSCQIAAVETPLAMTDSSSRDAKRSLLVSLLVIIALTTSLIQISGCGGGTTTPTLSATDAVKAKLTAVSSWKIQSATVDGVDQTAVYKGLALAFAATGYSSTNGGSVWPASGTWSFNDTNGTTVKRDDGLIVTVDVTDTSLKLSYTWTKTTLGGGRVESIKGAQVVTFTK